MFGISMNRVLYLVHTLILCGTHTILYSIHQRVHFKIMFDINLHNTYIINLQIIIEDILFFSEFRL